MIIYKKFTSALLFLPTITAYCLLPISRVFAADAYVLEMPLGGGTSASGPAEYVRLFFIYGLGLVGIVALFAFVFGGIRYMLSGGSETGTSEGKKWMFGALAGIILLFSSYLILNTINPALVSFKEPTLEKIEVQDLPEQINAPSSYGLAGTPSDFGIIPPGGVSESQLFSKANELSQKLTYVRGGDPQSGFTDCSGSAQRFRLEIGGTNPGRDSVSQLAEAKSSGYFSTDLNSLNPGDIIIRTSYSGGNHVGVYIGSGQVWNSTTGGWGTESVGKFMARGNLLGINKIH